MQILRNFAKCGGRDALTVLACTVVAFTAVAVAVAIIGNTEAGVLEIRPPETAALAPPQHEAFYVVRFPTEGRLAEPVKCRIGDRESFTVGYVYETITGPEWRGGRYNEKRGRGDYSEPLRVETGNDDEMELVGSRTYARGVPSERVLIKAPTSSGDRCFVATLTDERLPP